MFCVARITTKNEYRLLSKVPSKICNSKYVNSRALLKWYRKPVVDTMVKSAKEDIERLLEEFKNYNNINLKRHSQQKGTFLGNIGRGKCR
jgi:hypothetical protein